MTIDKAIKTLEAELKRKAPVLRNDYWDATQLGIEALKRELNNRSGSKYVIVAPLKGETK